MSDQEYLDYEPSDDDSEEETARYSQDEEESGSGSDGSAEDEEVAGDDPRADRFGEPVDASALSSVLKGYSRADKKEPTHLDHTCGSPGRVASTPVYTSLGACTLHPSTGCVSMTPQTTPSLWADLSRRSSSH